MARPPKASLDVAAIGAQMPDFEEAVVGPSLAERGRNPAHNPLRGCPLVVQLGADPNDLTAIEPGQWRNLGHADELGLPPRCPVTPLGKEGDLCWLLDTMGAVCALDARSSGKGPIEYLFGGLPGWLEWAFPRWSKGTEDTPPRVIGWDADLARQVLVSACAWRGYFALEDQVRGRGAWRGDDGKLIFHAGDAIYIDGKWRSPGVYGAGERARIYPARPKIGRPTTRHQLAGSDGPGEQLLEILQTFNWDRPELDPKLMLGWIVTAKVGGALDRRPVCFVPGGEGSGKSTLQTVLRAVMNGALIKSSNTTQAGIYQKLQQDSIAILVDELEAKDDTRTVDKILELARIAYSGDTMQRGGKDGVGKEFQLNSSFLGSSIAKPATEAQDDSRMVVCSLREREAAGGKLALSLNDLEAIGRHLLRRIFRWWPDWDRLVEALRAALIAAGHNDRACDTFAPLAAGCHVALSDAMPTAAELAQWGALLRADELAETAGRERTWQRCLKYILGAQPEIFRQRHYKSVGDVLAAYRTNPSNSADVEDYLPQVGLTLSWPRDDVMRSFETGRLFVPATSAALHHLFVGTPWAGRLAAPGPWIGVLRQAPKALWANGVCDKGLDRKARGIFIDLTKALEA